MKEKSSIIFDVWEKLKKMGELENLSDDEVLRKVVIVAEKLLGNRKINK